MSNITSEIQKLNQIIYVLKKQVISIVIDNFKWPIYSSILIDAPISSVWDAISKPGNLNKCHPFCKENTVVTWSEEKSVDLIQYYNGRELERIFFLWDEGKGYKLMIGRRGGRQTEVHWEIESVECEGKEKSLLKITLYLPHLQNIPVLLRWLPHFFYTQPKMKRYLNSVVRGFEYFITTGESVDRNQFGSHPWFSPNSD